MTTEVAAGRIMGRKKQPGGPRDAKVKNVKVRNDVHRAARTIAVNQDVQLEDLVDSILRPAIARRYKELFGKDMPEGDDT